jgi:hypothetical protein
VPNKPNVPNAPNTSNVNNAQKKKIQNLENKLKAKNAELNRAQKNAQNKINEAERKGNNKAREITLAAMKNVENLKRNKFALESSLNSIQKEKNNRERKISELENAQKNIENKIARAKANGTAEAQEKINNAMKELENIKREKNTRIQEIETNLRQKNTNLEKLKNDLNQARKNSEQKQLQLIETESKIQQAIKEEREAAESQINTLRRELNAEKAQKQQNINSAKEEVRRLTQEAANKNTVETRKALNNARRNYQQLMNETENAKRLKNKQIELTTLSINSGVNFSQNISNLTSLNAASNLEKRIMNAKQKAKETMIERNKEIQVLRNKLNQEKQQREKQIQNAHNETQRLVQEAKNSKNAEAKKIAEESQKQLQIFKNEQQKKNIKQREQADAYALLGAATTVNQLTTAYRKGSLKLHPNKGGNQNTFVKFTASYENKKKILIEEAEKKRLANEAEKKRLANEAEKKRLANEAEKKRLANEAEKKRLANEAEKKRLANEAEKKRLTNEAEKKLRNKKAKNVAALAKLLNSSSNLTNNNKVQFTRRLNKGENLKTVKNDAIKLIREKANIRRSEKIKLNLNTEKNRLKKLVTSSKLNTNPFWFKTINNLSSVNKGKNIEKNIKKRLQELDLQKASIKSRQRQLLNKHNPIPMSLRGNLNLRIRKAENKATLNALEKEIDEILSKQPKIIKKRKDELTKKVIDHDLMAGYQYRLSKLNTMEKINNLERYINIDIQRQKREANFAVKPPTGVNPMFQSEPTNVVTGMGDPKKVRGVPAAIRENKKEPVKGLVSIENAVRKEKSSFKKVGEKVVVNQKMQGVRNAANIARKQKAIREASATNRVKLARDLAAEQTRRGGSEKTKRAADVIKPPPRPGAEIKKPPPPPSRPGAEIKKPPPLPPRTGSSSLTNDNRRSAISSVNKLRSKLGGVKTTLYKQQIQRAETKAALNAIVRRATIESKKIA